MRHYWDTFRVFALQKSFSSLAIFRHKNATLSDCVSLKWRDELRAELDCASLALRVFALQKSFSSLAIFRHKNATLSDCVSLKWQDERGSNSRPPA